MFFIAKITVKQLYLLCFLAVLVGLLTSLLSLSKYLGRRFFVSRNLYKYAFRQKTRLFCLMAMNKIGVVVAIVLTCLLIAAASVIAANQPPNQEPVVPASTQTPDSTPTPEATPTLSPSVTPESTSTTQPTPTETPAAASSSTASPSPTSISFIVPDHVEVETKALSNLFNATLDYIFLDGTNQTAERHDYFGFGISGNYTYYPVDVALKLTYIGAPEDEPYGAKIEGYLVNLSTDTDVVASYICYVGTNLKTGFDPSRRNELTPQLDIALRSAAGTPNVFSLRLNLTAGESFSTTLGSTGSLGTLVNISRTLSVWTNGTPTEVTATVYRLGWIVFTEESVSFVANPASNDVLQEVQLEKVGVDFRYGNKPAS
jgi:hypothetical protein